MTRLRLASLALLVVGSFAGLHTASAERTGGPAPSARTGPRSGPARTKAKRSRNAAVRAAPKRRPKNRANKQSNAPPDIEFARRLLGRGAYRVLHAKTTKRLAVAPFDPKLHAVRMVGCGHYGDLRCVLDSEAFAALTNTLFHIRNEALAEALTHTGAYRASEELRRTALLENDRPMRTEWNYASLYLDLELAGDQTAACAVAWEAVAWNPDAPTAWALAARCAAATGSLDEAESYLWLGRRSGGDSLALSAARIDIHRSIGDANHSALLARQPTTSEQRSVRHTVARHRAMLAVQNPHPVIHSYDSQNWMLDGEIWHPELLATYGEAFAQAGHPDMASELMNRLETLYPNHPVTGAAMEAIQRATSAPSSDTTR